MVKEIERAGLPVVHMCTVVPISLTVGANRIVPAVAIPTPWATRNCLPPKKSSYGADWWKRLCVPLQTEVEGQTVFED
jgi:glycine reductase complex component B subunit gamma